MLARNLLALASAAALAVGVGGTFANWWLSLIVAGLVGALAVWMDYQHDVEVIVEEVEPAADPVDELGEQRMRRSEVR